MIFKDAASMMQGARSPRLQQSPISPNMKRSRLPLSQARITKFGTSGDIGTRDASTSNTPCKGGEELPSQSRLLATPALTCLSDLHREPTSSGFATPSAPCGKQGNYRSMDLGALEYAQSSSAMSAFGSGDDDYSGVPLPIACSDAQVEKTKPASVDAWLNDLLEATEDRLTLMPGQATEDETRPSQHASASSPPKSSKNKACQSSPTADKENIPPAGSSSPRIQTPRQYTQASTPSRFRGPSIQSPAVQHSPYPIKSPIRFPHPPTPNGHLSQPPIRKKARLNNQGTNMWDTPPQKEQRSTQDFTIHEAAMASALAKLSPSVERHRKGRRPKRERCISYWDTDILNPDTPAFPAATGCEAKQDRDEREQTHIRKGKAVLGECADSEALTREPPFIKGADGKKFDFECGSRPLSDCEMQEWLEDGMEGEDMHVCWQCEFPRDIRVFWGGGGVLCLLSRWAILLFVRIAVPCILTQGRKVYLTLSCLEHLQTFCAWVIRLLAQRLSILFYSVT